MIEHYNDFTPEFAEKESGVSADTIIEVARMFGTKVRYLPKRPGERYASALTNMHLSNKVYKHFGKIDLKKYIKKIVTNNS